jgi:hypothetical protein
MAAAVSAVEAAAGAVTVAAAVPEVMQAKNRSTLIVGLRAAAQAILADWLVKQGVGRLVAFTWGAVPP